MPAGSIVVDLLMKTGSFETDSKRAEKRMRAFGNEAKRVGKLVGAAFVAGAAVATTAYIRMADEMSQLNARLRLATKGQEAFNTAQRDTFRIAQDTGTAIDSVVDLYARAAQASEMLGLNQERTARLTESVSKALAISGTQGGQSAAVILQLSQALASGRVQAEEFNSIIDGAPRIVQAMADHFGIAFGEVKRHVTSGKVSSQELAAALLEASDKIDSEYSQMPLTVGRAIEQVRNSLKLMVGDTDSATGASSELAASISGLADTLNKPEVREGFNNLVQGAMTAIGTLVKFTSTVASTMKFLGEEVAARFNGAALDDIVRMGEEAERIRKQLAFVQENPVQGAIGNAMRGMVGLPTVAELKQRLGVLEKAIKDFYNSTGATKVSAAAAAPVTIGGLNLPQLNGGAGHAKPVRELANATRELTQAEKERLLYQEFQNEASDEALRSMRDAEAAARAHKDAIADLLSDMRFEYELLGMTNAERERAIVLRRANVDAASEEGAAISAMLESLQRQSDAAREQADLMDGLRDSARGFLHDLKEGKGVWDSLSEAADRFADVLFDLAAKKVIEQLFGRQGDGGGGNWGDAIAGFFGMFGFGGAKASGGDVLSDRAYLVGEDGPEMFVPRSAGAVIPADMTAAALGGGSGMTLVFNNRYAAPQDPRTMTQMAAKTGFEVQRATRRNG